MQKRCFKCGQVKGLAAFYPHPRMADGHLNKCIECAKADVRRDYAVKRADKSFYDAARNKTARRREQKREYQKRSRVKSPGKWKARQAVANAVREGRLVKNPCEVCGAINVEAHHDDYSKPLDVRWLCFKHHREVAH